MSQMTEADVIKALECCDTREWCNDCPLKDNDYCKNVLSEQSVDLINRKDQRIAELEVEVERLLEERTLQEIHIENQRISEKHLMNQNIECAKRLSKVRAEAYREFAELLKEVFTTIDGTFECWEVEEHIDNTLKELTESNE